MDDNKPGFLQFDRDGETSPRRLAVLVGGGVVALLLLLWLFRDPAPPTESAAPANVSPPAAAPVAAPSQPAPTNSVAELRLHGVMGIGDSGSAIISTGAGPQRLVRVGREGDSGRTVARGCGRSCTAARKWARGAACFCR